MGLNRLIFAICILTGLAVLYFKFDLFQGTAIYSGDASFIVRNSAHIGFWGLLITIVSFLLPYWSKQKPKPSPPTALMEPPPQMQIASAPSEALVKKEIKKEGETIEATTSAESERTPLELKNIYSKLNEMTPTQIEGVKKNYYGIWVRCCGPLFKPSQNDLILYLLPTGHLPAADNADPAARHSTIDNRCIGCAGVIGCQFKGPVQVISPGANPHRYTSFWHEGVVSRPYFADGISCTLDGGISISGVGTGSRIVSIG